MPNTSTKLHDFWQLSNTNRLAALQKLIKNNANYSDYFNTKNPACLALLKKFLAQGDNRAHFIELLHQIGLAHSLDTLMTLNTQFEKPILDHPRTFLASFKHRQSALKAAILLSTHSSGAYLRSLKAHLNLCNTLDTLDIMPRRECLSLLIPALAHAHTKPYLTLCFDLLLLLTPEKQSLESDLSLFIRFLAKLAIETTTQANTTLTDKIKKLLPVQHFDASIKTTLILGIDHNRYSETLLSESKNLQLPPTLSLPTFSTTSTRRLYHKLLRHITLCLFNLRHALPLQGLYASILYLSLKQTLTLSTEDSLELIFTLTTTSLQSKLGLEPLGLKIALSTLRLHSLDETHYQQVGLPLIIHLSQHNRPAIGFIFSLYCQEKTLPFQRLMHERNYTPTQIAFLLTSLVQCFERYQLTPPQGMPIHLYLLAQAQPRKSHTTDELITALLETSDESRMYLSILIHALHTCSPPRLHKIKNDIHRALTNYAAAPGNQDTDCALFTTSHRLYYALKDASLDSFGTLRILNKITHNQTDRFFTEFFNARIASVFSLIHLLKVCRLYFKLLLNLNQVEDAHRLLSHVFSHHSLLNLLAERPTKTNLQHLIETQTLLAKFFHHYPLSELESLLTFFSAQHLTTLKHLALAVIQHCGTGLSPRSCDTILLCLKHYWKLLPRENKQRFNLVLTISQLSLFSKKPMTLHKLLQAILAHCLSKLREKNLPPTDLSFHQEILFSFFTHYLISAIHLNADQQVLSYFYKHLFLSYRAITSSETDLVLSPKTSTHLLCFFENKGKVEKPSTERPSPQPF